MLKDNLEESFGNVAEVNGNNLENKDNKKRSLRKINQVTLSGYIHRDPEYKKTAAGKDMVTLSLGIGHNGWIRIIAFDVVASSIKEKVKSGMHIIVTGRISTYKPKDNVIYSVLADAFDILANTYMELKAREMGIDTNDAMTYEDIPF